MKKPPPVVGVKKLRGVSLPQIWVVLVVVEEQLRKSVIHVRKVTMKHLILLVDILCDFLISFRGNHVRPIGVFAVYQMGGSCNGINPIKCDFASGKGN